jgi:hypothetical protein
MGPSIKAVDRTVFEETSMANQCNTCGGFDKLDVCMHCTTVVCERCKMGHAPLCEELKKRKRRGEGPTIANMGTPPHRSGHETPPTTGPDRFVGKSRILEAPYKMDPADIRVDAVDQGLNAIAGLLGEKPNV